MLFESLLEIKETGEELNQQLVNNLCFYLDKTDFKPSWYVTVKCPRLYIRLVTPDVLQCTENVGS